MSGHNYTVLSIDALCYIDTIEGCVRYPLETSGDFTSYNELQANILRRQIELMIQEEMKTTTSEQETTDLHPQTSPSYHPTFSHSKLNLSSHFNAMVEKGEYIPLSSDDEKQQFNNKIKQSEPLYYYSSLVNNELLVSFGEESLRKSNEYLQKNIQALEREHRKLLIEIENTNKKRKREQFDMKEDFERIYENNLHTQQTIIKLNRECSDLSSRLKKIKQQQSSTNTE